LLPDHQREPGVGQVTELIDELQITITMYPDRVPYLYQTDIKKLREWAFEKLGPLGVMIREPGEGKITVYGGGIEVDWSNKGLHEIPELSGGDN
jgi:hypothetical protein